MKGLKEFDPTQQPHDLVVLLAIIGWVSAIVMLVIELMTLCH